MNESISRLIAAMTAAAPPPTKQAAAKAESNKLPALVTDSLQNLSAQALQKHLLNARPAIRREEDDAIAKRREELREELQALEDEKNSRIETRMAELDQYQQVALAQMHEIGGPDGFCEECMTFYRKETSNPCGIEGCDAHTRCPKCRRGLQRGIDRRISAPVYCERKRRHISYRIEVADEQRDWPSETGHVKCWICEATFCNNHFRDHYVDCRKSASRRCGFRPPCGLSDCEACSCVPGHCGKEVEGKEGKDYFYCYPEDGLCDALCCLDCSRVCPDGCHAIHCKEHAKQICYHCP